MAAARGLEIENTIHSDVRGIADNVLSIDDRVAGVDDRVADVYDRVRALEDVDDEVKRSWSPNCIHTGRAGLTILTENRLREELRRWLSPPDPSTNHKIARHAHHKGTATWFFEGRTYKQWKSIGSESLLWIHGKRAPVPFCHLMPPHNIPYL